MKISPRLIALAILMVALNTAHAQTGKDLLDVCRSNNPIERTSCTLYISGFVHGLQAAQDLNGEICIPNSLTGNEAASIFTGTLAEIETAAKDGRALSANPFFNSPQNAALAAALGMKFRCPRTEK
jgi:hypothetical protein